MNFFQEMLFTFRIAEAICEGAYKNPVKKWWVVTKTMGLKIWWELRYAEGVPPK